MARQKFSARLFVPKARLGFIAASLLILGVGPFIVRADTPRLGTRSLELASSQPSKSTVYTLSFLNNTATTIGSIELLFCANDPILNDPCTPPAGLDASQATITAQSGMTGFTVDAGSTANRLLLTRPPVLAVSGQNSYTLSPITNPKSAGSYYARVALYSSSDGSGTPVEVGGLAFAITDTLTISAQVPPYLLFCTGVQITNYDCTTAQGAYIDFGEFSSVHSSAATSQMLAATNAQSGYSIWADGHTLLSGNNVIPSLTQDDVSRPGTSQFGVNLTANTAPAVGATAAGPGTGTPLPPYNVPDQYRFIPDDPIAHVTTPDRYRKYTVSYMVNISKDQPAGVYASTLTYVCSANF